MARQFKPGQLQTGSLYNISASYSVTASYAMNGGGGGIVNTGSLVTTSSFNAFTASYTTGSFTGSFTGNGSGLTGIIFSSGTASAAISASFAQTASYYNEKDPIFVSKSGSFVTTSSFNSFTSSYSTGSFTGSFIGSLTGTASSAQTASYALNAVSSSYALTATNAPLYVQTSTTSSMLQPYVLTSSTASMSVLSSSYAATASNAPLYLPLTGGTVSGNLTVSGTASIAFLNVTYESASVIYSSGSNQFGDATNDVQTLIGTVIVSGSQQITGSLSVTNGITGSLLGTASYATQALTASYIQTAQTASYVLQAVSSSYALSASYAQTSSFLINNIDFSGSLRLYVSPGGSDTNNGIQPTTPFKTIKAAVASLGTINPLISKRYTIFVGTGTYTEDNPIAVPPGVAIVGDNLRTVRLLAANPKKDYFHCHDSNYFYGLRFIDMQYPSFVFSFPCSTATGSINSSGQVSSLSMVHSATGYTANQTNLDVGIIIESPNSITGSAVSATATVNTDSTGSIIAINLINSGSGYVIGEKFHISIPAPTAQQPFIAASPYVQNCSSITGPFTIDGQKIPITTPLPYDVNNILGSSVDPQGAGGGIRIDGNLVNPSSPLQSFVADAFTQVNQGGPGHLVINNGYAQFVSCFTTFCTYGFKVAAGGFGNISNSVCDFGNFGIISKKNYPISYNTGSVAEDKKSTVASLALITGGNGYSSSIANTASLTITGGGGSGATAYGKIASGSFTEVILTSTGSGYITAPSLIFPIPTSGSILTTATGSVSLSGVTEFLMNLVSGSRGVDISSNMLYSGSNYLVTGVSTTVNPNQRRVTVYPAPPSIIAPNTAIFTQLSNISTGGLVLEYVGSGVTYNALPKYGGIPNSGAEVTEIAPGKAFYSTLDNIGNLKIGPYFGVNQLTGDVTISATNFTLAGISSIGPFRRNGANVGVVLNEVSNVTSLQNSIGTVGQDTVPTQYAVQQYLISQGLTSTNVFAGNSATATTASYALTASYSKNLVISGSINNVNYIDFNTGSVEPAWNSGRVYWNNTDGALSVYNAEADIALQVGQESWVRVFNEGTTITNGTAVRLVGSHGDVPLIVRAQSQQVSGSALGDNQIIGIATHAIETNSIGYVTTQGLVRGLNTNAFTDGDLLFVSSSAGILTNVIPQAPYEVIQVGICVKAGPGGSGIIFCFPTQPIDFGDLASAERGTYQYGDIWSYQQTGSVGVWKHGTSLSGSYGITGSLNATSFTGSLLGTASYALTASFIDAGFY